MTRLPALLTLGDRPWSSYDIHHASPMAPDSSATLTLIAAPSGALRCKFPSPEAAQPAQNDNYINAKNLDQFYTHPKVAKRLLRILLKHIGTIAYLMVEPSAGEGAFFSIMPDGSLGFDLDPKFPGIMTADFLTLRILTDRKVAMVGNPPYGRNCDMAVAFFNRAAQQADLIAFVLPKTFRKASVIRRLDDSFHLVREVNVPKNAFFLRGKPRDVPTVFQIWERRSVPRAHVPRITTHPDFAIVDWHEADFAIQRVGAAAGTVHHNFELSHNSHYFIRGNVEAIMRRLAPKFAKVAKNTAGNPSLAMEEIVTLYSALLSKRSRNVRSVSKCKKSR